MTSQQIKIDKKRSKRAKQLASKQARAHRQAVSQMFPKVVYRNEGASPEFFGAVQRAMKEIVRNHSRLLGKRLPLLKRMKDRR